MTKKLLFLFVIASLSLVANAQTFNGNLTLSTQTQVDTFDYIRVTGNLTITDEGSDDIIKNLDGLSELAIIEGHVVSIYTKQITNLNGLSSLKKINGDLDIYSENLTDLSGLSALSYIGGTFFAIGGLHNIVELSGFESLTQIANLTIESCPNLTTISGFNSIKNLNNGLVIASCQSLESITGLNALQNTSFLRIDNNPELIDIGGLNNLGSVGGIITIKNNTSFDDFCDFYNLFNNNGISGTITIEDNAQNPTPEEIIANCGGTSSVSPIAEQGIFVYPNPAQNQISIDCPQFIGANIYSSSGTLMISSDKPEIYLQNLQHGLWIVKVKSEQGSFMTKFLKLK